MDLTANDACCACGGGHLISTNSSDLLSGNPPTTYCISGLVAGREIFVSVASVLKTLVFGETSEWSEPISAIPLAAPTSPVTDITWGDYNASHANVMWQDATSGPAASVYKVTWQDFGGGLLTGTQFTCFTGTKVQILTLTRLLTAPIRETIAYGPPALISPVTEGLQYKIVVYSRNLNYDPGYSVFLLYYYKSTNTDT
jgi:hypothetical protein